MLRAQSFCDRVGLFFPVVCVFGLASGLQGHLVKGDSDHKDGQTRKYAVSPLGTGWWLWPLFFTPSWS